LSGQRPTSPTASSGCPVKQTSFRSAVDYPEILPAPTARGGARARKEALVEERRIDLDFPSNGHGRC